MFTASFDPASYGWAHSAEEPLQIPMSKVDPHTERVNIFIIAVDP